MAGPLTLYRPQMIANRGRNTVKVPANLASGRYLVRFDLLALHEGQSPGGAQFYPSCAQIEVTGSGSTALPSGVAIPGFHTSSTPGVVWIYYSSSYNVERDYVAPDFMNNASLTHYHNLDFFQAINCARDIVEYHEHNNKCNFVLGIPIKHKHDVCFVDTVLSLFLCWSTAASTPHNRRTVVPPTSATAA
ncbi:hypothetical protein Rhopal_006933-T1 [Rhodotorula paludigena]|uniref:AA9 family lytic polysaccharide monooxygenase n=1 Tax=Rhodotorula paludigena TaxID=86838 RepID=A0AAV5GXI9_9BASI|nr:hypothetical protein Rhopal_006933-T1 [Rhodotorula paludigena]